MIFQMKKTFLNPQVRVGLPQQSPVVLPIQRFKERFFLIH
jgi:hypothetical protein